jgi:hypothetical protein
MVAKALEIHQMEVEATVVLVTKILNLKNGAYSVD